jgi:hypothetical protein
LNAFAIPARICFPRSPARDWQREARDLNAERYNAWRGRASPPGASLREGMTGAERNSLWLAGALALAAAACLVAFFSLT